LPDQKVEMTEKGPGGEPLTRGLILLGTGQAFFIVFGYAFHIYLARVLGPTDYGLFGFVFTVLVWLEIFTYGMRDAAIQYINMVPGSFFHLRRSFFRVQILISCTIFLLANLAFAPLALTNTRYDALFLVAFLDLPLMGIYQLYLGYLNAFRLYSRQSAGLIVYAVAKAAFIILLVWVGWGMTGALFGNIFSSLFAFITCFMLFRPKKESELAVTTGPQPDAWQVAVFPSTRSIISSSFLFIVIPLFYNLMMSADLWIANLVIGGETTGFYVAAGTVAKTVFFLFAAFNMAIFPAIVASLRRKDRLRSSRLFYLSFALFFFIALPASLLLAVNAREIAVLIYGSAYASSSSVIGILSLAYFFLTLKVFFIYILYAGEHRKEAVRTLLGITAAGLPLIYLLTRWIGIRGTALGTALACLCGCALSYVFIFRTMRLGWTIRKTALSVGIALLSFLPLLFIPKNQASFIPLSLLSVIIYYLCLVRVGLLASSFPRDLFKAVTGSFSDRGNS